MKIMTIERYFYGELMTLKNIFIRYC